MIGPLRDSLPPLPDTQTGASARPAAGDGSTTPAPAAPPPLSVALSHPALELLARAAEAIAATPPAGPRSPAPKAALAQSVATALRAFGLDAGRIGLLIEMTTIQTAIARLEQDVGVGLQLAAPFQKPAVAEGSSVPARATAAPVERTPLPPPDISAFDDTLLAPGTASRPERTSLPAESTAFVDIGVQREALLTRYDWLVFRWVRDGEDELPPWPLPKTRPLPDCALPCLSACTLRGAVDLRCPDEHAEKPGGACMLRSPAILSDTSQPLRLMTPPDRGG